MADKPKTRHHRASRDQTFWDAAARGSPDQALHRSRRTALFPRTLCPLLLRKTVWRKLGRGRDLYLQACAPNQRADLTRCYVPLKEGPSLLNQFRRLRHEPPAIGQR